MFDRNYSDSNLIVIEKYYSGKAYKLYKEGQKIIIKPGKLTDDSGLGFGSW